MVPASDRSRDKCWMHRVQRITDATDQISRHESDMGLCSVRHRDGASKQALAHEGAKVDVADLDEPQSIQVSRQAGIKTSTSLNVSSSRRMNAAAAKTGGGEMARRRRFQDRRRPADVLPVKPEKGHERNRIQNPGASRKSQGTEPIARKRSGTGTDPNWGDHHATVAIEGCDKRCETKPKSGRARFKRSQDGKPVDSQGQHDYDSGYRSIR